MKKTTLKKGRKQAKIFKIKLTSTKRVQVLDLLETQLQSFDKKKVKFKKIFIVTPNPEIVSMSTSDTLLYRALNLADISLPDGAGLLMATKYMRLRSYKGNPLRFILLVIQGLIVGGAVFVNKEWLEKDNIKLIHGREMFMDIIKLADKKKWKVVLLGGPRDVVEKAKDKLNKKYKNIKLLSILGPKLDNDGTPISKEEEEEREKEAIKKINDFKPHMLFVGFGAPKQEKWSYKWLNKLDVGGVMVVGGTFDYVAEKFPLPPKLFSKFELEWLWRLITQKGRVRRVLTAFPIFPLKVYWHKLTH